MRPRSYFGRLSSSSRKSNTDILREFIEVVKQNKVDAAAKAEFAAFVCELGEHCVILGCTELPLLVDGPIEGVELLDPMQAAIDYVVRAQAEAKRPIK